MKVLKYAIVECPGDGVPAFEKKINYLVDEGWELYGATLSCGLPRAGTRLFQALVLPVPRLRPGSVWVPATAVMSGHWEVLDKPPVKPN
jgi:hypothetical protein